MPTGYTSQLHDNEQTFEQFALTCTRAFGVCYEMRDDPMYKPIPEVFAPSDYHAKRLKKALIDLDFWQSATDEQCEAVGRREFEKESQKYGEEVRECSAREKRYQAMIEQVARWTPPSGEGFDNLKDFMLNQLQISMSDCRVWRTHPTLTDCKAAAVRGRKIAQAQSDIEYHSEAYEKEVKRCEEKTAWMKALRESLRTPPAVAA